MRTILEGNGSAWLSITNAAAGGNSVIDALTTAVAIESELDPGNIPPAATIGKVNATVSLAVLVRLGPTNDRQARTRRSEVRD